ncbi:uncharacterized protein LOC132797813 [Drosophila nasuta]|uniref:uncharacterized protein LOC132797813 n=1 Tax=Drosophila nasuta TaxID=42062 RepID=UPI00295F57F0|nr:uncharacterized protein LOC132797813 [Drosophila nasuta]
METVQCIYEQQQCQLMGLASVVQCMSKQKDKLSCQEKKSQTTLAETNAVLQQTQRNWEELQQQLHDKDVGWTQQTGSCTELKERDLRDRLALLQDEVSAMHTSSQRRSPSNHSNSNGSHSTSLNDSSGELCRLINDMESLRCVLELKQAEISTLQADRRAAALICAHAPTEEKDDATKDAFYAELDRAYGRCPSHDIKILLGDFNAKVGREDIFGATVGRFSLHETTSSNGLRLIGFAAAYNMVVRSTGFRHLDIHKASWLSPDRLTRNQVDHVVIDARHASNILDVRSCRGPNIDSDHYLVAAKIRTRLCVAKIARRSALRRLDIGKLQSQQAQNAFSTHVSGLLSRAPSIPQDISDICKDAAYRRTLQAGATRAIVDVYRLRRRYEKRLFRRKKKEQERRECESIESSRCRNEARNFYQRVKRLTQGFKSGAVACRDDDGNLVTEAKVVLRLWRDHFSSLLSGSSTDSEDYDPRTPIYGTDIEVPIPSHIEVKDAIQRLKNNKSAGADGLPAELFKTAGDMLVGSMHQLISKIWLTESMPEDWNLSMICPILKKGDATVRTNYRGISLLPVAYKVLTSVLCERLKPHAEALIGPYQCGFRPGKSTVDQIFTLRQILEKSYENQIDTYHLFVDYKAAFDSPGEIAYMPPCLSLVYQQS